MQSKGLERLKNISVKYNLLLSDVVSLYMKSVIAKDVLIYVGHLLKYKFSQ